MISAHIAGMPFEETLAQFAPVVGVGFFVGLRLMRQRLASRLGRGDR
jgi:hypothetical protein